MSEIISCRVITADGINGTAEIKSEGDQSWLYFPDGDITEQQDHPRIAAVINEALEWDKEKQAFRITAIQDAELVIQLHPLAELSDEDETFLAEHMSTGLPAEILANFPGALSLAMITAEGDVISPDSWHAPINLFGKVSIRDCIEIPK